MLWVDKYRPRTLDKVMVHREEATNLKNLVSVVELVGNLGLKRGVCGWRCVLLVVLMLVSFWVSDSAG
jgi:hypothetical protein